MSNLKRTIDDGFGNVFALCANPACDLCIVRPGKVQCSETCQWPETSPADTAVTG
jgi:hypothetical protein